MTDLDLLNLEGKERARRARERLTLQGYDFENLDERYKCYHEMFPYEFRPSTTVTEEHLYFCIAWDREQELFLISMPSNTFLTAVKYIEEVKFALLEPKTFYKRITGLEWPHQAPDRTPKPSQPEVTLKDLDL